MKRLIPAALVFLIAACSDGKSPVSPPTPTPDLHIEASDSVIGVSGTASLQVIATNASGDVVPAPTVEWVSLDPSVLDVDASGQVTALTQGRGRIQARAERDSATLELVVEGVDVPFQIAQQISGVREVVSIMAAEPAESGRIRLPDATEGAMIAALNEAGEPLAFAIGEGSEVTLDAHSTAVALVWLFLAPPFVSGDPAVTQDLTQRIPDHATYAAFLARISDAQRAGESLLATDDIVQSALVMAIDLAMTTLEQEGAAAMKELAAPNIPVRVSDEPEDASLLVANDSYVWWKVVTRDADGVQLDAKVVERREYGLWPPSFGGVQTATLAANDGQVTVWIGQDRETRRLVVVNIGSGAFELLTTAVGLTLHKEAVTSFVRDMFVAVMDPAALDALADGGGAQILWNVAGAIASNPELVVSQLTQWAAGTFVKSSPEKLAETLTKTLGRAFLVVRVLDGADLLLDQGPLIRDWVRYRDAESAIGVCQENGEIVRCGVEGRYSLVYDLAGTFRGIPRACTFTADMDVTLAGDSVTAVFHGDYQEGCHYDDFFERHYINWDPEGHSVSGSYADGILTLQHVAFGGVVEMSGPVTADGFDLRNAHSISTGGWEFTDFRWQGTYLGPLPEASLMAASAQRGGRNAAAIGTAVRQHP